MGKLKIASIGSSSSGNAYIVSDGNTRLLLDVGLTAKRIKRGLLSAGSVWRIFKGYLSHMNIPIT